MRRDRLDLVVLVAIAVVAALSLMFGSTSANPIRVIVGLPLALFAPGYALVSAAWPSVRPHWPHRIVLALGITLAVEALAGIVLNLTGPGLQPSTWTWFLCGVTVLGCAVAAVRRSRVRWFTFGRPRPVSLLAAAATGGFVLAAGFVATGGAVAQERQDGFTQMWIQSNTADSTSVDVALRNLQLSAMTYHVQVLDAGGNVTLDVPSVTVDPGQNWQTNVTIDPSQPANSQVTAVAYLGSDTTPYRRVRLVTRPPQG